MEIDYQAELEREETRGAVDQGVSFLSDEILVQRAREGSVEAFDLLGKRYMRAAYQTAYAVVGNRADAEDAVQEAMVKAHRYLHTLKEPAKVGGWLRTIVKQEASGRLRVVTRIRRLLSRLKNEPLPGPTEGLGKQHKKLWQQEAADYALRQLSERAREIVLLFYIEGLSCEEIAARTELSTGTVKSHLFKSRNKMLQALGSMGIRSVEELL
ncbi:MAG: RNA polymerase sigma factor [bacterium]|nr:RNA polymerase sigma factor [bacterium]